MARPTALTLTLFFYVTLFCTLTAASNSQGIQHIQHHGRTRFVTKRLALPQNSGAPLIAVGQSSAEATPTSTTAPTPVVSSTSSIPPSSAPESSHPSSVSASSSSNSSSSPPSSRTETSTPTKPTTTPAKESKPTAAPPPPEQPAPGPPPPPPPPVEVVKPTITRTQSVDAAAATSTEEPSSLPQDGSTKTKASNPLSVMVMVGASIAGCSILWTVFRKWKLKRSERFDARLRPITFP